MKRCEKESGRDPERTNPGLSPSPGLALSTEPWRGAFGRCWSTG